VLEFDQAASVEPVAIARCESGLATAAHKRVVCADSLSQHARVQVPQRAPLDRRTLLGVKSDRTHLLDRERADEFERHEQGRVGR
jgi:hypothetical protein